MLRRNTEMQEYFPATHSAGLAAIPTFGDLFQAFFSPSIHGSTTGAFKPALDLKETPEHYAIQVDVPGYTMDQIAVQLAENVLTLVGERAESAEATPAGKKAEEVRWHIAERPSGSFTRSIKFPVPVDAVNVKASLKAGVLSVIVPKGVEARPQKIKITEA